MSTQRVETPPPGPDKPPAPQRPRPAEAAACRTPAADESAVCPACGEGMRLWANYFRCRNCGYKESCCF